MRMLKHADDEALVLFDSPKSSMAPQTLKEYPSADFCELTSRFGNVTVGVAGGDQHTPANSGFWKKIGELFMDN